MYDLMLLASLILTAAAFPPAPAPGTIALVGSKNGQVDIYTVRSDGSELHQLTNDSAQETEVTWSPDGTRIAFISTITQPQTNYLHSHVFVVNADGSNRVQCTTEPMEWSSSLCWSADGTRIIYGRAYGVGIGLNLCAVNANGTNPARLTTNNLNDTDPDWSKTNRIAFLSNRTTTGFGIYTMNPDGSGTTKIATPPGLIYGPIRWSPDGTKILFTSQNHGGVTIARGDGSQADSVGEPSPDNVEWSRDGQKVVFADGGRYQGKIMVSTDSRVATPILGTEGSQSPTISPDGSTVAYAKLNGTDPVSFGPRYALYTVPILTSVAAKVPVDVIPVRSANGKPRFYIRWSPTDVPTSGTNPSPKPNDPGPIKHPIDPPIAPPAATGPGFPGTPVGPDRTSNPVGPSKSAGKELVVTAPGSVTVGDGFFGPEPMAIKVTRSAKLAKSPVRFSVAGLPPSANATVTGDEKGGQLTLNGLSSLAIGEYTLNVTATCGAITAKVPIKVVRKQARIMLVDDDFEGNNIDLIKDPANFFKGHLSKSDTYYRKMLDRGDGKRSLIYDAVGVDRYGNGPDAAKMQDYDLVLWYLGPSYGGNPDNTAVLSGVDETNVRAYLENGGGRTFILVGPGYMSNVSHGTPTSPSNEAHWTETDSIFLKKAVGITGARGMFVRFTEADLSVNGETFMMGKSPVEAQLSPVNPSTATALATTEMNPDGRGPRQVPVATWNRVGDGHMVYVGFTLEDVSVKAEKLFGMLMGIRIRGMANR